MWKELKGKSIGVFDAETDGFLENMTKVHCITVINAITKDSWLSANSAKNPQIIMDVLDDYDVLVGHNIIGYDLPMLKKMYGWVPKKHVIIIDTLWLSRMYHPDIEGGHSLGAWGSRLGNKKIEYYPVHDKEQPMYDPSADPKKTPGWEGSIYTETMGSYCDQDVAVNVDVFWKLVSMLEHFSYMSIICEMDTAMLIQRQIQHGFVFDYEKAEVLYAQLLGRQMELEDEVHETFKPLPKLTREVQPKVKMDGTLSSVGIKGLRELMGDVIGVPEFTRHVSPEGIKSVTYESGSFSTIEWPEFSLGSRQQIAERLVRAGYKLTNFTDKGNPIIDDAVLQTAADAGIPEAKPLAEYFLITKRVGMLKDWLAKSKWNEEQEVYRIHGYVNSLGATTNRMTHSSPNVAQVPSSHSPYGEECRSLFTVRKGYKLVGCDASGLELRTLAHYMNDLEYTDAILHGDIHTKNQYAAGLLTRDQAKTFIYAFLYGAGDAKIGQIVGGKAKDGKRLKAAFLEKTPALRKLREGILKAVESRKWLKGMDGRIIRIRSPHSALNTLLQGAGAIVMKYWLIEVARVADEEGLEWYPQANIHDEGQFEVLERDVPRFSEICVAAFPVVSKILKSNCLLEGEAKVGDNWSETH